VVRGGVAYVGGQAKSIALEVDPRPGKRQGRHDEIDEALERELAIERPKAFLEQGPEGLEAHPRIAGFLETLVDEELEPGLDRREGRDDDDRRDDDRRLRVAAGHRVRAPLLEDTAG